jgi:dTDP-glucose pyrophosphorylase
MKVKKAVITSAGNATRMRPISNIIPKGLLPIFKTYEGKKFPIPMIDLIIDSLSGAGVSQLCFVLGSRGRLLMDYLFENNITFVFQKESLGFGDAVLKAEEFCSGDPFFVHTNDDMLTGGYREGAAVFDELGADCLLFLSRVENPKLWGIVEVEDFKDMHSHKVFRIKSIEEKPESPKSDLAVSGIYIFSGSAIFGRLKEIRTDKELQLTDGIQKLVQGGAKVYGMLLGEERWLSVGNPESYFSTLNYSYNKL